MAKESITFHSYQPRIEDKDRIDIFQDLPLDSKTNEKYYWSMRMDQNGNYIPIVQFWATENNASGTPGGNQPFYRLDQLRDIFVFNSRKPLTIPAIPGPVEGPQGRSTPLHIPRAPFLQAAWPVHVTPIQSEFAISIIPAVDGEIEYGIFLLPKTSNSGVNAYTQPATNDVAGSIAYFEVVCVSDQVQQLSYISGNRDIKIGWYTRPDGSGGFKGFNSTENKLKLAYFGDPGYAYENGAFMGIGLNGAGGNDVPHINTSPNREDSDGYIQVPFTRPSATELLPSLLTGGGFNPTDATFELASAAKRGAILSADGLQEARAFTNVLYGKIQVSSKDLAVGLEGFISYRGNIWQIVNAAADPNTPSTWSVEISRV